ncbi:MAG: HAMP domain-containing sensor histidine kinase [bacterium]|nr:HAMP domain-containing sensor histidine kinase [bacterium]
MRNFKLWVTFTFIIVLCLLFGFFITGIFSFFLVKAGIIVFGAPFPHMPLVGFIVSAACISIGLILLISRYYFEPLQDLIHALNAVASGDFHVRLPESSKNKNMLAIHVNFNKMMKELNSIETLQSDFIQNVSHEIKTPLAAIEGYASLLFSSDLPEEQHEYTKRILESSRQLSSLTSNILKLSKLENQQFIPEKKLFSLDEQLRQAILTMEPLWSRKHLDIDIELPEIFYCSNEELMIQVWTNLLSNAIKFTPDSGAIFVGAAETEKEIQVTFRDSGIGMTEEVQAHIFDKFYQAESSRTIEGNGLGLALVKKILSLCGGNIQVKSLPDYGSSFTVFLPK